MDPTQSVFAKLFTAELDRSMFSQVSVAKKLGVHGTTISKWKREDNPHGPPAPAKRRELERILGLARGFFDGDESVQGPKKPKMRLWRSDADQTTEGSPGDKKALREAIKRIYDFIGAAEEVVVILQDRLEP